MGEQDINFKIISLIKEFSGNSSFMAREIITLRAENERLKAEVAKYKSFWDTHFSEPFNDSHGTLTVGSTEKGGE